MSTADLARNLQILGSYLVGADAPGEPYVTGHSHNGNVYATWYLFGSGYEGDPEKQRTLAVQIIRAIGGHWDKADKGFFHFTHQVAPGVILEVIVEREAVCRRVVTGTREVTRTIPAIEAQPEREVTETVEDVEWECEPVLPEVSA